MNSFNLNKLKILKKIKTDAVQRGTEKESR